MNDVVDVNVAPTAADNPIPRWNLLVPLLIVVFGISSWDAVNGLWVELPVLVNKLPESWKLASYIVITSQLGNLGPIAFSAARKIWSQNVLEVPMIHITLWIVITAAILLSFFWDTTTMLFGELHSTPLLVLAFCMSFVDCMSSVLYLPFIANFREQYVIYYLIGSGLSGPVPSLVAMAQGVGGYAECRNVTVNTTIDNETTIDYKLKPYYPPPRFSPNIFFAVLSVQMFISWVAFVLLNRLPQARRERVPLTPGGEDQDSNRLLDETSQNSFTDRNFSPSINNPNQSQECLLGNPRLPVAHYYLLLFIQAFLSTIHTGVLLSIQTYSCMPYGSMAYHLTATLSTFASPLCTAISLFFKVTNVYALSGLATFITGWSIYILVIALLSPTPPLVDMAIGAALIVIAWIVVSGSVSFTKACITSVLRREGGQVAMFHFGVVTQVGSAIGALVTFSLIQYTTIFKSYKPCS